MGGAKSRLTKAIRQRGLLRTSRHPARFKQPRKRSYLTRSSLDDRRLEGGSVSAEARSSTSEERLQSSAIQGSNEDGVAKGLENKRQTIMGSINIEKSRLKRSKSQETSRKQGWNAGRYCSARLLPVGRLRSGASDRALPIAPTDPSAQAPNAHEENSHPPTHPCELGFVFMLYHAVLDFHLPVPLTVIV